MNTVIKRDKRMVPFDKDKIISAIGKAMARTEHGIDEALSSYITNKIEQEKESLTVEEIQDLVEKYLMQSDRPDAAKQYILYRAERTKERNKNNVFIKDALEKISATNIVNSNANVDENTFGGRKNEASSALQKEVALEYNMSPDIAAAHRNGYIYEHDLDQYNLGTHNCLFIDFQKLFKNGFSTRNGDVRPPNSFSTACQLVAVACQIQSQAQFGGVASDHIDYDLAPFVSKSYKKHFIDGLKYIALMEEEDIDDFELNNGEICLSNEKLFSNTYPLVTKYARDMLEREGKQAAQGLYHNLNTLESRAGSQVNGCLA